MNNITYVLTCHTKRYLYECLMSLIAQTNKNFNLIIVVDNHNVTDLTDYVNYLTKYIKCNDLTINTVQGTGSAGFVRNYGISRSITDWVTYIDGDDYIMPNTTEVINETINSVSESVNLINTGWGLINSKGEVTIDQYSLEYMPTERLYYQKTWGGTHRMSQLMIFRKSTWSKYKFNEDYKMGEDTDFVTHQLLLGKYHRIKEALYMYRNTPGSIVHTNYNNSDTNIYISRAKEGYYTKLFENRDKSISFI